jgi:hypothetical protein
VERRPQRVLRREHRRIAQVQRRQHRVDLDRRSARNGTIAITSYTRAYDRNGINLDYAYWSVGRDRRRHGAGAADMAGAHINRITTQSENPQVQFVSTDDDGNIYQGVFIGDYSAVAMGDDLRIHPCWTDFRGRPGKTEPNQDAYTQTIGLARH